MGQDPAGPVEVYTVTTTIRRQRTAASTMLHGRGPSPSAVPEQRWHTRRHMLNGAGATKPLQWGNQYSTGDQPAALPNEGDWPGWSTTR